MAEIPLPEPSKDDIFSLGFGRDLNKELQSQPSPMVYDAVGDATPTQSLNFNTLIAGAASSLFTVDPTRGMWMGSSKFDTAPFAVSMNGELRATTSSVQSFSSSGTWTKPTNGNVAFIQVWAAGGSGGKGSNGGNGGGGGGGGGYTERWVLLSSLSSTESVTVGIGGATVSTNDTAGNVGGNSMFGAFVTAYGGGGGGRESGGGGGGGGLFSAGSVGGADDGGAGGQPSNSAIGNGGTGGATGNPGSINFDGGGGGGGGADATTGATGGLAVKGGGGGGGGGETGGGNGGNSSYGGGGGGGGTDNNSAGTGGTSLFGGNGGNGGVDTTPGTAGTLPGGGGGGSENANSGAGADGKVIVTVF